MIPMRQNLWRLLLLLVCLGVPMTGAQAQSDEAFLQYRQKLMQSNSANYGAIRRILKHKLPYQSHIVTHAQEIQLGSTLIAEGFKKEITAGKTDAKPDIWKDWDKFAAAAKALERESAKLAVVAQSGGMADIAAQVKAVGKSCGGCHKPFRKPKAERFKR